MGELTKQEREKIIEVLLSQERVLTLLYDKTFPPRTMVKQGIVNRETSLHNFTYMNEDLMSNTEPDYGPRDSRGFNK